MLQLRASYTLHLCCPLSRTNPGHLALEGRSSAAPSTSGKADVPVLPAPAPLHHCVWMAMELLGPDLWTARDAGRAFVGCTCAADLIAVGQAALRVGDLVLALTPCIQLHVAWSKWACPHKQAA